MQFNVSNGGESRTVGDDQLQVVCKELTEKYGPAGLKVEPAGESEHESAASDDDDGPPDTQQTPALPATTAREGEVCEWGKQRAERDEKLAIANGFAPPQPIYAIGTKVVELGVENARRSRLEWEQLPTITDGCELLRADVVAEQRRDETLPLTSLAMGVDGYLATGDTRYPLASKAFRQLVGRIGCNGAEYLENGCWPELRSHNINEQIQNFRAAEAASLDEWRGKVRKMGPKAGSPPEPKNVVLRTRRNDVMVDGREIFALVSEKYQAGIGIDFLARAIGAAVPADARGTIDYDGDRAKFNCLWHSDVRADDYVAGEMFKAGVIVRADDTGSGGISVSAIVFRNLCLNLIVIGRDEQKIANIRHVGDLGSLRKQFAQAFEKALTKVEDFRKAWGFAANENVVAKVQELYPETQKLTLQDVIPGIFSAVIEREKVPVRAKRRDAVPMLVQKFYEDEVDQQRGFTRAAVVNAFTRYAHHELNDPFQQEEVERAASGLLFPKKGRSELEALPWEPFGA